MRFVRSCAAFFIDSTKTFTNANFMKITHTIKLLLLHGASFLFLNNFGHAGTLAASKTSSSDPNSFSAKVSSLISGSELAVKVDGAVCSFCANGIRKDLSKCNFVDATGKNKGITLDTKNQLLIVRLRKDMNANVTKVFDSIRKGGYKPVKAYTKGVDGKLLEHVPQNKK